MATTVKTLQRAWNCRWNRLGYRLRGVEERQQPESLWVCVRRPGERCCVTEQECEECGFWEAEDLDVAAPS